MIYPLGLPKTQFNLCRWTLFPARLIILAMVYVLNATLFKPINRILADRDNARGDV